MRKTRFAGLTQLDPGESIDSDNASFQARSPDVTDRFLEIGAVSHRHNAHAALPDPTAAPSGAIDETSGSIPADLDIFVGYTLLDSTGGETEISPLITLTTPPPLDAPTSPLSASASYNGGNLRVDTYYYAVTLADDAGGETAVGPTVAVDRQPGLPNAQVTIGGLTSDFGLTGATAWRLYRAVGGQTLSYLASGNAATYLDNGSVAADPSRPPPTVNRTQRTNSLQIQLPASAGLASAGAISVRLYGSRTGAFAGPALFGEYPVGSGGHIVVFDKLDFFDGTPPDVSTCVRGAAQIDPDSELYDWHWKRPVASRADLGSGARGDVRLAYDTGFVWAVLNASGAVSGGDWAALYAASAFVPSGGVTLPVTAGLLGNIAGSGSVPAATGLEFLGSGAVAIAATNTGGSAQITITGFPTDTRFPVSAGRSGNPTGSGAVARVTGVEFLGSGCVSVAATDAGGSGAVTITAYPTDIRFPVIAGRSGNPTGSGALGRATGLEFLGSGAVTVAATDDGGSGAVTITGLQTDIRFPVIAGSAGAPTASGALGLVTGLEFRGSGNVSVRVDDDTGSAIVSFTGPPTGGDPTQPALRRGLRRGTRAERVAAQPVDGLVWHETDTGFAYYGDGVSWIVTKRDGQVAKQASGFVVNASSALVFDPELKVPFQPGDKMFVEGLILVQAGGNAADWLFGWDGPVGMNADWGGYARGADVGGGMFVDNAPTATAQTTRGIAGTQNGPSANGKTWHHIAGVFTAGVTGGNLTFKWAQNTPTAENMAVMDGSHLRLRLLN